MTESRDQKAPRMATRLYKKPRQLDEAAQKRAQAHLHLADALAWRQYHRCGQTVPLEELQGEAQLALAYAASLYDEGKGVPFGAYVTMVIRHRLVQAVTLWRRGGRLDHVRFTDLGMEDFGDDAVAFDLPCSEASEPGRQAAIHELIEQVRRELPARWFTVLLLYFGHNYSLEAIGEQLGISRQRVKQLLSKAITRVRSRCFKAYTSWQGL